MPKILAIDDKQDNLITLSAILKNLIPECHVITAQSGTEGLEKAKIHSPDTILLDIKMPGMDGYEVCKKLKEDKSTSAIPVILISAIQTGAKDLVKGLHTGADAYLAKPIDEHILIAQVKTALRMKEAEDLLRRQKESLEEMVRERTAELINSNVQLKREIAERKQAEEALRESEVFLKTLIDAIPTPVFYKDRHGKYLGFNRAFETFFGETKERLIGKSVFDINPPELAGAYHAQDDELFISGGIQSYESQWETAQGKLRDFIFNKAVFTDSTGVVAGLIGVLIDITERKKAEKEREKFRDQLTQSQKMEAVGTLAGGIAHDFNNILAIILGNAELASDDVPDWNPASESLKEIRLASIRAKNMVRQLLAFSRKTEEESKPIDMAPIIKESMKMLRPAIPTSMEFKQHISDDPCNILGDASQINQIVMNLAINAADAMSEEGGLLEVTLEKIILQEEKVCFDWVLSPGPYVRLRMRDTGEGIEPEIMDRIFEPYYTTKEIGKGTGMGLSVIHGIVKRHGGGIRVESELGKGNGLRDLFPRIGRDG